jgi:hypothetical protein
MKDERIMSPDRSDQDLRRQLVQVRDALGRAFSPIEAGFQKAGEDLSRAVESLQRISRASMDLSRKMAENTLADFTQRLLQAAARVSTAAEQSGQTSLAALVAMTTGIEERVERLNRTIAEARILGINAKIEAAHVSTGNVDFSVFTREIGRLAELAEASLGKFAGELLSLGRRIGQAQRDQDEFARENQQSLASVIGRLESNLTRIRDRQKSAIQTSDTLAARSQSIVALVAKAVADLQIGDITRQRVEHVAHGLTIGENLLDAAPATPPTAQQGEGRALAIEICRLQAAQLRNANADFSRELARIDETIRALANDAEGIHRLSQAVFGTAGAGGSSFLDEVGHDLEQACGLLQRFAQTHDRVEQVTGQVSAGVAEMVQYLSAVHSIEADMRIMGLNATLKCSRLGKEGLALSVIAQELRAVANRTADDGTVIMKGLEQLIAEAESLASPDHSTTGSDVTGLADEMQDAIRMLGTTNHELSQTMAALEDDSRSIGAALASALSHETLRMDSTRALEDVLVHLETLAASSLDDAIHDPAVIKERVLALMKGRYTMASEHEIHALFDEGAQTSSLSTTVAASASSDIDIDSFML